MSTKFQIDMNATELLNAAQALRQSAGEAYDDERYVTAVMQNRMAGRFYVMLGNDQRAMQCFHQARAIEAEMAAIAAGEEEVV